MRILRFAVALKKVTELLNELPIQKIPSSYDLGSHMNIK